MKQFSENPKDRMTWRTIKSISFTGDITDKEILRRTKEDVHSIGKLRVNVPLRNLPEFLKAFNIQPTDSMYLAENKRAVIW